jgi:transposase-like protein
MAEIKINLEDPVVQSMLGGDFTDFETIVGKILSAALDEKATELVGAGRYERTEDRKAYRNGYRTRWITMTIGRVQVKVPQLRGGEIDTGSLKQMPRMERSLVLCVIEMYISGVSTRKVRKVMEPLCGDSISKSTVSRLCKELDKDIKDWNSRDLSEHSCPLLTVDALYIKVRSGRQVIKRAVLVAVGLDAEGHRSILGLTVAAKESEYSWTEFFKSLRDRGLRGVRFVISDKHEGLVSAADKNFPEASWHRCQVHFRRNVMSHVAPKRKKEVSEDLDRIFNATNSEDAKKIIDEVMDKYAEDIKDVTEMLDDGKEDILAIYVLPKKYRERFRSTNMIERLNEEIRRREKVIRIFPNDLAAMRLIGAVLMEKDEEWSTGRIYLDMEKFWDAIAELDKKRENSLQYTSGEKLMIKAT